MAQFGKMIAFNKIPNKSEKLFHRIEQFYPFFRAKITIRPARLVAIPPLRSPLRRLCPAKTGIKNAGAMRARVQICFINFSSKPSG